MKSLAFVLTTVFTIPTLAETVVCQGRSGDMTISYDRRHGYTLEYSHINQNPENSFQISQYEIGGSFEPVRDQAILANLTSKPGGKVAIGGMWNDRKTNVFITLADNTPASGQPFGNQARLMKINIMAPAGFSDQVAPTELGEFVAYSDCRIINASQDPTQNGIFENAYSETFQH